MKKVLISTGIVLSLIGVGSYFYLKPATPLVSVVMPTYNRADLLPRSIESILNQDYKNFEFIIVDDGSSDNSLEVIQSYQQKDNRIKLLKNETNRGISFSRNRGTDEAKGKYVAIMDSDDFSEPQRLSKSVDYLEAHPDVMAVNALYYEMGKEKNGLNNWVPPKRFEIIFNLRNYFTNIAVFRRDFVKDNHIRYDETRLSSEDYDFWKQIFLNGGKLHMLNEQLIRLRRHRSNSEEYYKQIRENSYKTSNELLSRFGIFPDPNETRDECKIMKEMVEKNKDKNIVDQYVMEITYDRACAHEEKLKKGTIYIKHLDYVDYFVPTGEKRMFERRRTKERYRLVHNHEKSYIFRRESDGLVEEFLRQKDGSLGYSGERGYFFYLKAVVANFFANQGRKKLRASK